MRTVACCNLPQIHIGLYIVKICNVQGPSFKAKFSFLSVSLVKNHGDFPDISALELTELLGI